MSFIAANTINVRDFGAKGDGTADDTAAVQACFDQAAAKQTVFFPTGSYKLTAPITITKSVTIKGEGQYTTVLLFVGCNGLSVSSGVSNSKVCEIEIATSVRYTTTPNSYVGMTIDGATGSRPQNWVFEDVFFDGWGTAFDASWLWSSRFRNFRAGSVHVGLAIHHLSVNNFFSHGSLGGSSAAGSRGFFLDGTVTASEGWVISDSLLDNFEIAILGQGVTHCKVQGNIIDHCLAYGIYIRDGVGFGGNWEVSNNYIAMIGAGGTAALQNGNAIANATNTGNTIIGNRMLAYPGATCAYGIRSGPGADAGPDLIEGNTLRNFTMDIRADGGNADVAILNNRALTLSAPTANIYGGRWVSGNVAQNVLHVAAQLKYHSLGDKLFMVGDAPPTTGTWALGTVMWNRLPAAGTPIGWVCALAGTPGTWRAFGMITPTIPVRTVTADTTSVPATDDLIVVDATSGPVTITLAAPTAAERNQVRVVKSDATANNVIIDPAGSTLINGQSNLVLSSPNDGLTCIYNPTATNWRAM